MAKGKLISFQLQAHFQGHSCSQLHSLIKLTNGKLQIKQFLFQPWVHYWGQNFAATEVWKQKTWFTTFVSKRILDHISFFRPVVRYMYMNMLTTGMIIFQNISSLPAVPQVTWTFSSALSVTLNRNRNRGNYYIIILI